VAVAVIRDNLRPRIPDDLEMPHEYSELMTGCWHPDPAIRPTFLEVMTRLSAIAGDHTSMGGTSMTTTSSGISMSGGSTSAGTGSVSSSSASSVVGLAPTINGNGGGGGSSGVAPPEGEMAVVFTDITRAASLWEHDPAAMRDATMTHNDILRSLLKKHRGYEALFARGGHHNSGEGSFCMAFQEAGNAVEWCMEAQQALLKAEWPRRLLEHPGAGEEWGDTDDRVLFRGLRVRMGIHVGSPRSKRDPTTRRVEYSGAAIDIAARITALTHGGQILVSGPAFVKLKSEKVLRFARVGRFDVTGSPSGTPSPSELKRSVVPPPPDTRISVGG
jgi:class 3 adenylate cyclase